MNLTSSDLRIANLALTKIGSGKITAFADLVDRELETIYTQIRDRLLMRYPWNFARTREAMTPNEEAPAFEWEYEYDLPDDFLGRPELYDSDAEFVIEGRTLLCNEDTINLKYTAQVTDTYLFTPLFIECFVLAIASELCIPNANSRTMKADLDAELRTKLLDGWLLNEYDNNLAVIEEETTWQTEGH
jgi:hypothetical protein